MTRKRQSLEIRIQTLGDYSIGEDKRWAVKENVFISKCRSYAILFQSCIKLNLNRFFVGYPHYHENMEGGISKNNIIFIVRKLKELEQKVLELDIELKFRMQNESRGSQDNKCLRAILVGLISILFVLAMK
ncbi:hypothetical protein PIB30_037392 [Stylosanthes scabra]|uniref:Uncharacterized protein n=1 Tax=Stylosanthes scabra TaxID=79078 RepID=A0ABU6XBR8_9FABA|nr:hypothetical protein [Stylosanthes scabra]